MASPIPVFPLVASTTVCPGFSFPVRSASSITPRASRSFTDPRGLNASTFTYRFTSGGASRLILTTGVLPTVSVMFTNLLIPSTSECTQLYRGDFARLLDLSSGECPDLATYGRIARKLLDSHRPGKSPQKRISINAHHRRCTSIADWYPKACNWPHLARQDVKERESSDDSRSRSDDSYSPRRHWCPV